MTVTLDELKRHLMIEVDDASEDAYLLSILEVAEDAVRKNLNVTDEEVLEASSIQSILVLAGTLYSNRESVSYSTPTKVPHTLDYLISLNKNYGEGRL